MVEQGETAVAEAEVGAPDATFRLAAFWRCAEGLLRDGVEYWVTVGGDEVPAGRAGSREAPGGM